MTRIRGENARNLVSSARFIAIDRQCRMSILKRRQYHLVVYMSLCVITTGEYH